MEDWKMMENGCYKASKSQSIKISFLEDEAQVKVQSTYDEGGHQSEVDQASNLISLESTPNLESDGATTLDQKLHIIRHHCSTRVSIIWVQLHMHLGFEFPWLKWC